MNNTSNSASSSFEMLHPILKQWIWEKRWESLHDAQERSIPILMGASSDVLIGASTASGKTEAAFLPILSRIAELDPAEQLVLHVSPLKALINDQYERLNLICERLDIPVIPWHGDSSQSNKQKFFKTPRGIVLITPESLEAIFVNKGSQVSRLFKNLQYVVVDELHVFVGTERGRQLQSLLHRLELAIGKSIPRAALSATLGDMGLAAKFLRDNPDVQIINSGSNGGKLLLSMKAFYLPAIKNKDQPEIKLDDSLEAFNVDQLAEEEQAQEEEIDPSQISDIARHIYKVTRDSKNLIFPNSRQKVEYYADSLRALCELDKRPVCYWPHHGNLSRDLREDVEALLKKPDLPANAVATSTLELGVDIGDVKSVAQIGCSGSVASLRQRLGRSGRKPGTSSILRYYSLCRETKADSSPIDMLHADLVTSIATIQLLVRGWYEPPKPNYLHLSTLVHQMLSCIAQHSHRTARELWNDLIQTGPHKGLSKAEFKDLILFLGSRELITQDSDGALLLGSVGESMVSHYEFYTVFPLADEYRVESYGRMIGTITKDNLLAIGQKIVFAGRRWTILAIHTDTNIIEVESARGGQAITFGGSSGDIHDVVIEEVRAILESDVNYPYLDDVAKQTLNASRDFYRRAKLNEGRMLTHKGDVYFFTWKGTVITQTLAYALRSYEVDVKVGSFYVVAQGVGIERLMEIFSEIQGSEDIKSIFESIVPPELNRWDWAIPLNLRRLDFLARACNVNGLQKLLAGLFPIE